MPTEQDIARIADAPEAERARLYVEAAEQLQSRNLDDSTRLGRLALEQARARAERVAQFDAHAVLAANALLATRPADAEPHVQEMEALLTDPALARRGAEVGVLRGRIALVGRQFDLAVTLLDAAVTRAREQGQRSTEARALHNLGLAMMRLGRQDEAIARLDAALALNVADGRERDAAANRHFLGTIAREQGRYADALDLHRHVLDYARRADDTQIIAHSANALGILSANQYAPESAMAYYEEAAAAYEKLGDRYSQAMALINIGNAWSLDDEPERALPPLEQALALALDERSADAEALARAERAKVLWDLGRHDEAEQDARAAVALTATGSTPMRRGQTLNALGRVLLDRGDSTAALGLLEQAAAASREAGRKVELRDSLRALARAQAAEGRNDEASRTLQAFLDLDTELRTEETSRKLAELRAGFEAQQREAELAAQQQRIALLEQQATQQGRIRVLMAIALATSLLFLLAMWSRYRTRRDTEAQLRIQNDRIERANADLALAASTDVLTQARNRRHFQREILPRLQAARTAGRPYGLLMIDADHFKTINDQHGHDVGDTALIAIVAAWRRVLGANDELVRWGGEEFLAVLFESNRERTESIVAAGLNAVRASAVDTPTAPLVVTVSVGWVHGPSGPDIGAELTAADQALLRAKAEGRDRAVSANDTHP
jgi:diguanylate cyclase (GGDEF)-like protein